MKKYEVELLAPAGSYECLEAAIKSGADAVYVGGSKFGARAFAENFGLEELKKAIDYVHLHDKKLFLTINTLLKEDELNNQLYEYIKPLYEHGLDAVIVQDLGVLIFIKEKFPDLPIHASTQMTVTSKYGLKFLEELGVERVVTSRELSLEEVTSITKNTDLEIESFVHGALCYGYSGQCIYSSLIGGRSGNRGQCAQPCRLPYEVNSKTAHFLSLKDICTLPYIDKLIECGVYSFKIEGRMKKPEYVAAVTSLYRKYIDEYIKNGVINVSEIDMDMLKDVFNRGGFSSGYWLQKNGPDMVTFDKPSHTGVPILKAINQKGNKLSVKALKTINKGDIIDIIANGDNYTFGKDYEIGSIIELNLRKGIKINKGSTLFRTRNNKLLSSIDEDLSNNKFQKEIQGFAKFELGKPCVLTLVDGENSVTIHGPIVEKAMNRSATLEDVKKQLNKMGTTQFKYNNLSVTMDDNIFIPVQVIKELRREAVITLEKEVYSKYRRTIKEISCKSVPKENHTAENFRPTYTLYIENKLQLDEVVKGHTFERVYLNSEILDDKDIQLIIKKLSEQEAEVYIVFPHIIRQKQIKILENLYEKTKEMQIKGIMIRNIETYQFLIDKKYSGEILLDHHIHVFNSYTREYWLKKGVKMLSSSPELKYSELLSIDHEDMEFSLYGNATMMVSAQCLQKTSSGCTKKTGITDMKDRKNVAFYVKNSCKFCYNLIFNNAPTSLLSERDSIKSINPTFVRTSLTVEDANETRKVLQLIEKFQNGENFEIGNSTLGNFRKGIK